jgi:hypothetical protein
VTRAEWVKRDVLGAHERTMEARREQALRRCTCGHPPRDHTGHCQARYCVCAKYSEAPRIKPGDRTMVNIPT